MAHIAHSSQLETAKQIFQNSNIKFTCEGKRHLGAALGTEEFKIPYLNEKVDDWCKEMKNVSKLSRMQPSRPTSTGNNINSPTFNEQ